MGIDDITKLRAAITRRAHRKDLDGDFADCIALAESRIKALLWDRLQDQLGELTTTAGESRVLLPVDFLQMRSLAIIGMRAPLTYVTPDVFNANWAGRSGQPSVYTIVGTSLHLGPVPDAEYALSAAYRAEFPRLTDDEPTNDLLRRWPDLYMWAALVEVHEITRDEAQQQKAEGRFRAALDGANAVTWNAAGPMAVRTDVEHQ